MAPIPLEKSATVVQLALIGRVTSLLCVMILIRPVQKNRINFYILNRYRRGLETCPQAKTFNSDRSATTLFSFLFSDASERRVWLSAESKIFAFTFERFCLYRLKFPHTNNKKCATGEHGCTASETCVNHYQGTNVCTESHCFKYFAGIDIPYYDIRSLGTVSEQLFDYKNTELAATC